MKCTKIARKSNRRRKLVTIQRIATAKNHKDSIFTAKNKIKERERSARAGHGGAWKCLVWKRKGDKETRPDLPSESMTADRKRESRDRLPSSLLFHHNNKYSAFYLRTQSTAVGFPIYNKNRSISQVPILRPLSEADMVTLSRVSYGRNHLLCCWSREVKIKS